MKTAEMLSKVQKYLIFKRNTCKYFEFFKRVYIFYFMYIWFCYV